jgi:hypothetical protein
VFDTFTWSNPAALAWLTIALIASVSVVVYAPTVFVWLCALGAMLISVGVGATGIRTGRWYSYFVNWNWIEGLLAITGCVLMFGSCIGMLIASWVK